MPKFTKPLAKSIRTGEGILVYATNVVLALAAVLPNGLSWTHTALYLTILNAVHVISRTALKATAVQKAVGLGGAVTVDPIDPAELADILRTALGEAETRAQVVHPAGSTPLR